MKKRGTYIFIVLFSLVILTSITSAQEITIDYPNEMAYGEEVYIDLGLVDFAEGVYDIKIDISNSTADRVSEIRNGDSWQSSYNYVEEIINTSIESSFLFMLNLTQEQYGEGEIEVKVRSQTNVVKTFAGYLANFTQLDETENTLPNTNQETQNTTDPTEISVNLNLDEEVEQESEIDLEIEFFDLEDKNYDVKIFVTFEDNDTIISETYDNGLEKWVNGKYYTEEAVSGDGDKTEDFTIRIDGDYEDYVGDVRLWIRLRETGKSDYILEDYEYFEITEKQQEEEDLIEESEESITSASYTSEEEQKSVIKLGNYESVAEEENKDSQVLYESGMEKAKKYAIYVFSIILLIVIIVLLKSKL